MPYSKNMQHLLTLMLKVNESARPTIDELMLHPLFVGDKPSTLNVLQIEEKEEEKKSDSPPAVVLTTDQLID